jgi:hypothetical protein
LIGALLVIALFASSAAATPLRTAALGNYAPEYGPTLGGGYVYWSEVRRDATYFFQRRLADNQKRVVLRAKRASSEAIFASGDKVAFEVSWTARRGSHEHSPIFAEAVYAMSSQDGAPTLVKSAKLKVKHAKKKSDVYDFCGRGLELRGLSSSGQVVIDDTQFKCSGLKNTVRSFVYSLTGAPPIRVPSLVGADVTSLDFGKLIFSNGNSIIARDLATGVSTRYPGYESPDQVTMDAEGRLLTVTTEVNPHPKQKYDAWRTRINVYPPGSTKPSATIYRHWFDSSTVIFCGDGFAEFTAPRKGPMLLTFRSFDGTVVNRLKGPPTDQEYDGRCVGRHLTLATSSHSGFGTPKISEYDF